MPNNSTLINHTQKWLSNVVIQHSLCPFAKRDNYTNRSPYPMLHILREASVEAALKNYPNPEKIPVRNTQLTKSLGVKTMRALLADCYK